jgi:hypothetical protein
MDVEEQSKAFREHETTAVRTADARMSMDPGFVHHRLIHQVIGTPAMQVLNQAIEAVPAGLPDYQRRLQIDHLYVDALIRLCSHFGIQTLSQMLAASKGHLFASVETTLPCPEVYLDKRVSVELRPKFGTDIRLTLEFATERIVADTTRMQLANGAELALVAQLRSFEPESHEMVLEPLVIGGPTLEPASPLLSADEAMWLGYTFGEVFPEDINELSRLLEVKKPPDIAVMEHVSERAFKQCLAEILGQEAATDWGGEQSDLYSSHLHLNSRRVSGAFLLKGPAKFKPMQLNHLGANNDQIVRLSKEPADLLVVQHSHEIGPAVRDTLRAFATGLGPVRRRYCFIDGADSLRILMAYGKLERAQALTVAERANRKPQANR